MKGLAKPDRYDAVIIGGGHAGCEAALACARLGLKTIMFCINLDSVAMMPCNPNIGGTSKGHLVREIDALGGEMGKNIDKTFIQSRMLNTSKGPAVQSLRAQADKRAYSSEMKRTLENTGGLTIKQQEIIAVNVDETGKVNSVTSESGALIETKTVVLCAGTYLNSRCLYGNVVSECGPNGYKNSIRLTDKLKALGINFYRFKTGTPARIDGKTVDYSKFSEQYGDEIIVPFSFENVDKNISKPQVSCWLGYTNEKTHSIIRGNIHRSPMYTGVIEGTGTRYCPSIEDKVVRFADKERHQIFIEPEGLDTNEMYISGMSTSLPEDVQTEMYCSVEGLENAVITRNGYAIEYDCVDSTQLKLSLEFKNFPGLFSAGQLNGSSGYEEAACQGLIAGINAAMLVNGKAPIVLGRDEAYIGVLIDDLVTKGTNEPYRMMTSRAEYRLLLRQDNADLRLTEIGYGAGLIDQERFLMFAAKRDLIRDEINRVGSVNIPPSETVNSLLAEHGSAGLSTGIKLADLIKRAELSYDMLAPLDPERKPLPPSVREQVNIAVKYEGYLKRQSIQVEQFKKLEKRLLPKDFDYSSLKGISLEARQKLNSFRPENVGQASRITGISPADISVLLVCMEYGSKS